MINAMNAQEMLDYSLGHLDGAARGQVEREAAADPALADRLERLERALDRLLDDGEEIEPPAGLAARTVAFVAEHRVRQRRRSIYDFVPVKVPFRWADVAVAATILLAGLLTLMPAVRRSRERMDQAGCGFNLQQLGLGLAQYAGAHDCYPYAGPEGPVAHAGSFAAMLHEAGLLEDPSRLDCPCDGSSCPRGPLPDLKTMARLRVEDPDRYRELLSWDYAYNVGYRHPSGRPGPIAATLSAIVPLLADQPAHEDAQRILDGNSPNHSGRGQNVLFTDLHVGWHNTRRLGPHDADMFLNDERRPGPGVRLMDAALLPGLFPFAGR
jgi:hypothetical protein